MCTGSWYKCFSCSGYSQNNWKTTTLSLFWITQSPLFSDTTLRTKVTLSKIIQKLPWTRNIVQMIVTMVIMPFWSPPPSASTPSSLWHFRTILLPWMPGHWHFHIPHSQCHGCLGFCNNLKEEKLRKWITGIGWTFALHGSERNSGKIKRVTL